MWLIEANKKADPDTVLFQAYTKFLPAGSFPSFQKGTPRRSEKNTEIFLNAAHIATDFHKSSYIYQLIFE
jgi:hypothetical protein